MSQAARCLKMHPIPDALFDELLRFWKPSISATSPMSIPISRRTSSKAKDGRPYLIDFQISFDLHDFGNNFITPQILRACKKKIAYHILKHSELRPDLLTEAEKAAAKKVSWFIKAHRFITRPYFLIRRRTFKRLRESGQLAPEGSK